MLSRIFWISVAGFALIAGIAVQDGDFLSWDDHDEVSARSERSIEERVDRAIDRSFDKMQVEGPDGREVDVPAETKRALAAAVGELVKAEADFAMARVGEDDEEEMQAASARRDRARAEINRLKAEIKKLEQTARTDDSNALRDQIRREVREDIRESVRDSVGG